VIKVGCYAVAAPFAVVLAWLTQAVADVPLLVTVFTAALVVGSSTWPGLAQSRYKGRLHPAAALVRGSAVLGYRFRTTQDQPRGDLDRGPTYCLEWCVLAGVAVGVVFALVPPLAGWAGWFGAAVAVGCAAHVFIGLTTPTGAPVSAVWNWWRHGEVWARHSLGWCDTDSGGDRALAVPALFLVTGVMVLGMVGWLGPLLGLLTGWS
jgi:hypothetical protein